MKLISYTLFYINMIGLFIKIDGGGSLIKVFAMDNASEVGDTSLASESFFYFLCFYNFIKLVNKYK